jgi:hypothetical protein
MASNDLVKTHRPAGEEAAIISEIAKLPVGQAGILSGTRE